MLFAIASSAIVFMAIGCGGGSSTPIAQASLWQQQGATYTGRVACRDCHANIYDQYAQQPMGNMTNYADTRHTQAANCNGCHVTGFGEPTGGMLNGSTPHLDGVGCESCHGPGSKHIAASTTAERKKQITRVPPDKTCMDCHGDRKSTPDGYRPGALNEPFTQVTSDSFRETNPGSVRGPHYPPAAFLLGRKGFEHTQASPSPHSTLPNTCLNCHQKNISGATGKVDHGEFAQVPNTDTSRPECASCHGGGRTSGQLVQTAINAMLIELAGEDSANPGHYDSSTAGGLLGAYAATHSIALSSNNDKDNPRVIAYKAARYNIRYVISDHSLGVHNPAFAKRLLEEAKALLQQ